MGCSLTLAVSTFLPRMRKPWLLLWGGWGGTGCWRLFLLGGGGLFFLHLVFYFEDFSLSQSLETQILLGTPEIPLLWLDVFGKEEGG